VGNILRGKWHATNTSTLAGTFEHALNHLLDHAIDLSGFDAWFRNDATSAAAYTGTWYLCRRSASSLLPAQFASCYCSRRPTQAML
jgi:hypothetical protein